MGDVGSGFDTAVLRGRPSARPEGADAARAHRSLRAAAAATVFVLVCAPSFPSGEAVLVGSARAAALLAPSAAMPPRAEVVLLADGVQIESSRRGATPEGAALARLAADLRARAW